jgi:hypothetical protein
MDYDNKGIVYGVYSQKHVTHLHRFSRAVFEVTGYLCWICLELDAKDKLRELGYPESSLKNLLRVEHNA